MRVLTWNCNGAFRKKLEFLDRLNVDLMIIQECENPEQVHYGQTDWSQNFIWTGTNKHKGLGVFARKGITLEKLDWKSRGLKFFVPCRVNNDFDLVGVWCHYARTFGYIGQFWKYLRMHKDKLKHCLIAGDFNSNVFWDKPRRNWNHSDVVNALRDIGIESLYHNRFSEQQGSETRKTFFLYKDLTKAYHIDYAFASKVIGGRCSRLLVGEAAEWLSASDHMPIILDL